MRKHPYIIAILVATLLSVIVWLCVPKEYSAITKVSDEYKEVDLAIGMNSMTASIKEAMGGANTGLNDIETYHKLLKTEDFARHIAHVQVPGRHQTYGEYIATEDTIETIQDHIVYNYSEKQGTLIISFTDHNPLVASQMLDSVTVHLQDLVTDYRHKIAEAALENAKKEMTVAEQEYRQAQKRYDDYTDAHVNISSHQVRIQEHALEKEVTLCYNNYKEAANQYARQQALKQRSYLSFAVVQNNRVPMKPNTYYIGYLLCFLFIALLLTHGYKRYCAMKDQGFSLADFGDWFSPWAITLLIWLFILGGYYILDTKLYPIEEQFYYCLILWLPIFCICSLGTYHLSADHSKNTAGRNSFEFNKGVFNFFFVLSLIITPLYVYQIMQIVMMFGTEDILSNIRRLAIFGEGQGFLNYSIVINQSLLVVALWAHPKVPTWQVITITVACLMNSLAIMEKGSLFFIFICIIFVLFEKRIIKLRSILVFGIIMVLVFYVFNLARAEEGSDYQEEETLLDFIAMYVLSPPVAFCQLSEDVTPQFGTNTFEIVYLFLARLGVPDIIVKQKLQEFVWVPIPTNVYTIFQPFFMDFAYKGVAFFAAVYGCISGWLYRLYKNGDSVGCCLYTYAVYALLLQFYQENIFLSFVFVLQFTFFVVLFAQQRIKFNFYHH